MYSSKSGSNEARVLSGESEPRQDPLVSRVCLGDFEVYEQSSAYQPSSSDGTFPGYSCGSAQPSKPEAASEQRVIEESICVEKRCQSSRVGCVDWHGESGERGKAQREFLTNESRAEAQPSAGSRAKPTIYSITLLPMVYIKSFSPDNNEEPQYPDSEFMHSASTR